MATSRVGVRPRARAAPVRSDPVSHSRTEEKGTCPHYDRDAQGRNVGCRFDDIHAVSPLSLVVVSGTSDTVRVPCTELSMELEEIGE